MSTQERTGDVNTAIARSGKKAPLMSVSISGLKRNCREASGKVPSSGPTMQN